MAFSKSTAERPGYRTSGHKKTLLINKANKIILELGSKGVHLQNMMTMYKIKADSLTTTTKEWSGVIGRLKQFRLDWNV
jgi:hypothetical protein